MMRNETNSEYNAIGQVLEDMRTADVLPIGGLGKIYAALDKLRASRASHEFVAVAENISVAMQRLELARRRRDNETEQTLRERLAALSNDWAELTGAGSATAISATDTPDYALAS